jgi:hypothetical protein
MRIFSLFICVLIFATFGNGFAEEAVTVIPHQTGVKIVVANPKIRLSHSFPRITNIQEVDYIAPDSAALEKISFTLAVPAGSEPQAVLNSFRFKTVEKFSADFKKTDIQPEITVNKLGIKRGVHLVHVSFQPYDFKNGKLSILDSAVIYVDFGVNVSNGKALKMRETDAGFFTGILNQSQLPAIFTESVKTRNANRVLKAGNGWYDPAKDYVKVTTTRDGVAKIKMSDVLASQPAFKNKNTSHFHLIFKGEKYPFAFINDNNSIADEADEIVFLGKRAAGDTTWFDTYTNEAVFYLTYDESVEGEFLKEMPRGNAGVEITSAKIFRHIEFDKAYNVGDRDGYNHNTEADIGEGFYWQKIDTNQPFIYDFYMSPGINAQDSVEVSAKFHTSINSPEAKLRIFINDIGGERITAGSLYDGFVKVKVSAKEVKQNKNTIRIESYNHRNSIYIDHLLINGVARTEVREGAAQFFIEKLKENAVLKLTGLSSASGFAIDSVRHSFVVINGANGYIPLQIDNEYHLTIGQGNGIESAQVRPVFQSELVKETNQADVLIITHNDFEPEALRLADFRAKTRDLTTKVVDVEDIYKEFGFGRHSPHAIKTFLKHAYDSWQKPAPGYIILFGDASWDARKVTEGATETDFIPVYGKPVSDYWFTLLEGDDFLNEMHIGRLPARNSVEAKAIVNKIIEYDTLQPQPWMKKFMAITGGDNVNEAAKLFENFAGELSSILVNPLSGFSADTATFSRFIPNVDGSGIPDFIPKEDKKGSEAIGNNAKQYINEGTAWVSFMGHGSPQITEIGNWMPEHISNGSRYFFLNTFSCQIGAFAEPIQSINEQFIRAENKGAIAAFGTTGFGFIDIDGGFAYRLAEGIVKNNLREFGQIIDYAKYQLRPDVAPFKDRQYFKNTVMQYSLLGDPLTRFPVDTATDLYFIEQDIETRTESGLQTFTVDDKNVHFKTFIRNNGTAFGQKLNDREFFVYAVREYNGDKDTVFLTINSVGFKEGIEFSVDIFSKPGRHTITLIADPDSSVTENRRNNNSFTYTFEVYEKTPLALDPLPFWDVNSESPEFRIINPFKNSKSEFDYDFSISSIDTSAPQNLTQSSTRGNSSGILVTDTHIDWKPSITLLAGKGYNLQARLYNRKTDQESNWLTVPFTAVSSSKNNRATWSIHSKKHFDLNRVEGLTNVNVDSTDALSLDVLKIPVRVVSVGDPRSASIEVGDDYQGSRADREGIHIRVYAPNDTDAKYSNHYTEMYTNHADDAAGVLNTDNIINLFKSDTIANGDFVLITFSEGSIYGALRDSATTTRWIDFKNVFKSIGSALIDSFDMGDSYAIFGRKGMKPGEALEAWNGTRDSVVINSYFPFVATSGKIETAIIGPAKNWDSVAVNGNLPLSLKKWNWTISALDRTRTSGKIVFSGDSLKTISIDSLSAQDYPFLKMEVAIPKENLDENVFLKSISAVFEPEAELALVPSTMNMEPYTDILRGDSAVSTVTFKNISRRSASPVLKANFDVKAQNGSPQINVNHIIPQLQPDEETGFKDTIGTANFTLQSTVTLFGDPEKALNELYTFNNLASYPLLISDDTIPPMIDLFVDGKEVITGDMIQLKPSVLIRLWDNSRLGINAENTEIRINGGVFDSAEFSKKYHRQFPRLDTIGEYHFVPLKLENGENSFIITAKDAAGNSAEKRVKLIVSMNYFAENISNSPNPFSEGTTFSFTYKGQELSVLGSVEIHNLSGQKVRDMNFTAELGENTFFWDGRDNIGTQLPAGMYFYKIQLRGLMNTESAYGKCVIIR